MEDPVLDEMIKDLIGPDEGGEDATPEDKVKKLVERVIETKLTELAEDMSPENEEAFRAEVRKKVTESQEAADDAPEENGQNDFRKFNIGLGLPGAIVLLKALLRLAGYTDKRQKYIIKNLKLPGGATDARFGTAFEFSIEVNGKRIEYLACNEAVGEDYNIYAELEKIDPHITDKEKEIVRKQMGMTLSMGSTVFGHLVGENVLFFTELKKRLPQGVNIKNHAFNTEKVYMCYQNEETHEMYEPYLAVVLRQK
jgi:hypothetical protein